MTRVALGFLGDLHPQAACRAAAEWNAPIWLAESEGGADPFVTAATLFADRPERPVGFAVLVSALRHPWFVANACRSLAASGGDVRLGIGIGDVAWKRRIGIDANATVAALAGEISRLREYLAAPIPGWADAAKWKSVPIFVGAEGPRMVEMTAKNADGLILPFLRTDAHLRERVEWLKREAPQARVITEVVVGVDASPEAAAGKLRRWMNFITKRPNYRDVLAAAGLSEAQITDYQAAPSGTAALPLEVLRQLCVLGSPAECAHEIARRYKDWSDEVVLVTPGRYAADLVEVARALSSNVKTGSNGEFDVGA